MKIAIASTGKTVDSKIDARFGRCSYFAFYDEESKDVEFLENEQKNSLQGAGPATVQFVASQNADKIVSGEFGQKVKTICDQLQIQLIIVADSNKTVQDIINSHNK
ncbi:MAG: NifB/NifX family molybdenum-iron cluster-binding protein [Bacteroidales bacterium]